MSESLGIGSRAAALFQALSAIGLHGFRGIRIGGRVVAIYESLAKAKGSANVTVADMVAAIKADADLKVEDTGHPFLDLLIKYLPFILSILASLFNFPIPPLPAK